MLGTQIIRNLIRNIDKFVVNAYLSVFEENSIVICLCFHAVFKNYGESKSNLILPQQGLTCTEYEIIFDHFLEHGYQFVSYDNLLSGLEPGGRYVYVTFDDGYSNNSQLLGTLEQYNIPIHLFVVTDNMLSGHRFWWDIIFNEGIKKGWSIRDISRTIYQQKFQSVKATRKYITSIFGQKSHKSLSDVDRPYTVDELVELEQSKLITIGNHTTDHTILDTTSLGDAMKKVRSAQHTLTQCIGSTPTAFAFPNGNYTNGLIRELTKNNMKLLFTLENGRNRLHHQTTNRECTIWGRFCFEPNIDLERQCKMFRAANVSLNVKVTRIARFLEQIDVRNQTRGYIDVTRK